MINTNGFLVAVHGLVVFRPFVKDPSDVMENPCNFLVASSPSVSNGNIIGFPVVFHCLVKFSFKKMVGCLFVIFPLVIVFMKKV